MAFPFNLIGSLSWALFNMARGHFFCDDDIVIYKTHFMHQPHICKSETFLSGKNCHCHCVIKRCIFNEQAFIKTQI